MSILAVGASEDAVWMFNLLIFLEVIKVIFILLILTFLVLEKSKLHQSIQEKLLKKVK